MIIGILLLNLMALLILMAIGIVLVVTLKFMGYEPTDMEECFEEEEYE